mgnify:CR=1 FL=1
MAVYPWFRKLHFVHLATRALLRLRLHNATQPRTLAGLFAGTAVPYATVSRVGTLRYFHLQRSILRIPLLDAALHDTTFTYSLLATLRHLAIPPLTRVPAADLTLCLDNTYLTRAQAPLHCTLRRPLSTLTTTRPRPLLTVLTLER